MIERLVDGALELTVAGSYSRIGYAARSRLAALDAAASASTGAWHS